MFNLIAGAFLPASGQVIFKGEDMTSLASNQRFRRGLVRTFQIPQEFHSLTVIENLMMVPPDQPGERILSNWFSPNRIAQAEEENRARAWEALEFLELTDVAYERAGRLSGGQKKLLELGRTLMTASELVLLDETAAGVNRTLVRKLEDNEERVLLGGAAHERCHVRTGLGAAPVSKKRIGLNREPRWPRGGLRRSILIGNAAARSNERSWLRRSTRRLGTRVL